jgi:hypothetical protein
LGTMALDAVVARLADDIAGRGQRFSED